MVQGCVSLMSVKQISQLNNKFKYVRIFRPFIMIQDSLQPTESYIHRYN